MVLIYIYIYIRSLLSIVCCYSPRLREKMQLRPSGTVNGMKTSSGSLARRPDSCRCAALLH